MLKLRCSSLPLAFLCPASVRPEGIRLNEAHEAAYGGSAAHEVVRQLPQHGAIDWDSVPDIAGRFSADPDEVRMLAACAVKMWRGDVGAWFADAWTEVSLSAEIAPGVELTGHADLMALRFRTFHMGDWKGGRKDRDHSHQVRGYAALALAAFPDVDEANGTIVWLRDQDVEHYVMNRERARTWVAQLVDQVANWDGVYRPGNHCAHCPRNHECEAANAVIRRDVAAIADKSIVARVECELEQMSPAELVAVLRKADLVVRFAERVRVAVKAHVERVGDVVADGVRLTITEEPRREVDPVKAWPVLEQLGFGDEDYGEAIGTLTISRLEKVAKRKAEKGKGASNVRKLHALLKESGAVSVRTIRKLQEKRA